MKKIIQFFLIFFLISALCPAYTLDEILKYPGKHTSYYGGSFSPVLMEKVREFSGNAEEYLETLDNFDGYENHHCLKSVMPGFPKNFSRP